MSSARFASFLLRWFPNDEALLRLLGMLLIEQNDEWAVGRRYFSLASMTALNDAPEAVWS